MADRPSTPPPLKGRGQPSLAPPTPGTPGTPGHPIDGNWITGSQHARVPPSPGVIPGASFSDFASLPTSILAPSSLQSRVQERSVISPRAGSGVSKVKSKGRSDAAKLLDAAARQKKGKSHKSGKMLEKPFRFMDLPGEIRNMIYHHTYSSQNQALLVHRPRLASLRVRTRLDRSRPLASDIADQKQDEQLGKDVSSKSKRDTKNQVIPRNTNRPFHALTQTSRQIRSEYRPIYLQKQEIGMDLTDVVAYLCAFYPDASDMGSALEKAVDGKVDMPFTGNLTIAVADVPKGAELRALGVDVWPLLDIWANSWKIEAGFGRYMKWDYTPERDGEAKDLYRLFGRRVLRDRSCSSMNTLWRTILRTRSLAAVHIHRNRTLAVNYQRGAPTAGLPSSRTSATRPYIHILFRQESAESWMTDLDSKVPNMWLVDRGFGAMEHFKVKVGVLAHK